MLWTKRGAGPREEWGFCLGETLGAGGKGGHPQILPRRAGGWWAGASPVGGLVGQKSGNWAPGCQLLQNLNSLQIVQNCEIVSLGAGEDKAQVPVRPIGGPGSGAGRSASARAALLPSSRKSLSVNGVLRASDGCQWWGVK